MIKAIVLFPVINININKQSIDNKLVETCNLAKAISLKVVHKESFFLKKPDPSTLIRKGKTLLSYTKTQKKKFEYNIEEHIEALKIKLTKGRNKTFRRKRIQLEP